MNEILAGVERILADASLGFVEKMIALPVVPERPDGAGSSRSSSGDLQRHVPGMWDGDREFPPGEDLQELQVISKPAAARAIFRATSTSTSSWRCSSASSRSSSSGPILRSGPVAGRGVRVGIKVFFPGILTDKGGGAWTRRPGPRPCSSLRKEGVS